MKFSLSSPESGDWFSLRRISALKDVNLTASSFKVVRKAISIATVEGASLGKDGLTIGKVLDPAQVEK